MATLAESETQSRRLREFDTQERRSAVSFSKSFYPGRPVIDQH